MKLGRTWEDLEEIEELLELTCAERDIKGYIKETIKRLEIGCDCHPRFRMPSCLFDDLRSPICSVHPKKGEIKTSQERLIKIFASSSRIVAEKDDSVEIWEQKLKEFLKEANSHNPSKGESKKQTIRKKVIAEVKHKCVMCDTPGWLRGTLPGFLGCSFEFFKAMDNLPLFREKEDLHDYAEKFKRGGKTFWLIKTPSFPYNHVWYNALANPIRRWMTGTFDLLYKYKFPDLTFAGKKKAVFKYPGNLMLEAFFELDASETENGEIRCVSTVPFGICPGCEKTYMTPDLICVKRPGFVISAKAKIKGALLPTDFVHVLKHKDCKEEEGILILEKAPEKPTEKLIAQKNEIQKIAKDVLSKALENPIYVPLDIDFSPNFKLIKTHRAQLYAQRGEEEKDEQVQQETILIYTLESVILTFILREFVNSHLKVYCELGKAEDTGKAEDIGKSNPPEVKADVKLSIPEPQKLKFLTRKDKTLKVEIELNGEN